jgi:hypothetical protein
LNFIQRNFIPQRARHAGLLFALALLVACGGRRGLSTSDMAPVDPEAAVRAFLNAVKANSLIAMRELWGTERGPATNFMNTQEVDQRLTVIRTFLEHDKFEFAQPNEVDPSNSVQRIVKARLTRKTCQPVVPFTVVPWGKGWLVKNIDLPSAGNPARNCGEAGSGSIPGT